MKKLYLIFSIFIIAPLFNSNAAFEESKIDDGVVSKISKYIVQFPKKFDDVTKGYAGGIGSSAIFKEKKENGNLVFYTITDRGPNATGPLTTQGDETILYPTPDFSPYIAEVEVTPGKSANVTKVIEIKKDGKKVGSISRKIYHKIKIKNYNTDFNTPKGANRHALDSESLAIDKDGNFWVGDEFRPSISKISPKGETLAMYKPGEGLPKILSHFTYNMGFESLTITPSGKIYGILEGVMNINEETNKFARFMRILELDPQTMKTKMFAYPYRPDFYKNIRWIKIGDMESVDDTKFLLVEQSRDKQGDMQNFIYAIDLKEASDITGITLDNGKPLEYGSYEELNKIIKMAKKKLVIDPRKYGWNFAKLEGLTIIDNQTIALTNDDDFGSAEAYIIGDQDKNLDNYLIDSKTKKLIKKSGQETQAKIKIKDNKKRAETSLWIISLKKKLSHYFKQAD